MMLNKNTLKTDGIAVSSSIICQGTSISIGCAPYLVFVF